MLRNLSLGCIILCGFLALAAGRGNSAGGSPLMDMLRELEKRRRSQKEFSSPQPTTPTVTIKYTAEQIDTIKKRAQAAWKQYLRLRPELRKDDPREQAYASRAAALRYRLKAVERLLAEEKRNPTKKGPVTVPEALTWLDRATAAVEYDHDRVTLRMAQEAIMPANQPFCVCAAGAQARVSPFLPGGHPPVRTVALSLAVGEAESVQLVVVPLWVPLENVSVEPGPLFRRDSLERISPDQVRLWLVESIRNRPAAGRERLWPDPLSPAREFDVPATASQSLLLNIRAAEDQTPGVYEGRLTIRADGVAPVRIGLLVNVRPFSITAHIPTVAFWVRNKELAACFSGDQPMRLATDCERALRDFDLRLYRPKSADMRAAGWQGWLPARNIQLAEVLASDPYSVAAPSSLAYRQAGWAAWQLHLRGLGSNRWLLPDLVATDRKRENLEGNPTAPMLWGEWKAGDSAPPPGLIHINAESQPEPTLRLVAVRDGIEDFAYLSLLSERLTKAKELKAAGWWKMHRWKRLLRIDSAISEPAGSARRAEAELLKRRERIAGAIEEIDRAIKKKTRR